MKPQDILIKSCKISALFSPKHMFSSSVKKANARFLHTHALQHTANMAPLLKMAGIISGALPYTTSPSSFSIYCIHYRITYVCKKRKKEKRKEKEKHILYIYIYIKKLTDQETRSLHFVNTTSSIGHYSYSPLFEQVPFFHSYQQTVF
jgi:hypothetical protein